MVDFDIILDYLDNVFTNDEKAMEILNKAGITSAQIKVINTLIISALKAYDAEIRSK